MGQVLGRKTKSKSDWHAKYPTKNTIGGVGGEANIKSDSYTQNSTENTIHEFGGLIGMEICYTSSILKGMIVDVWASDDGYCLDFAIEYPKYSDIVWTDLQSCTDQAWKDYYHYTDGSLAPNRERIYDEWTFQVGSGNLHDWEHRYGLCKLNDIFRISPSILKNTPSGTIIKEDRKRAQNLQQVQRRNERLSTNRHLTYYDPKKLGYRAEKNSMESK
jgi:hypothetical protein